MNQMDFHSYQEVKGQKYLGIATVNYNGVMLRYKIVMTKDGSSYFPAPASYNVGPEGQDRYIAAFCIDSNMQNEILKELILQKISEYYHKLQSAVAAMDHQTIAPLPAPVRANPALTFPSMGRDRVDVNQNASAFQTQPTWPEECTPF